MRNVYPKAARLAIVILGAAVIVGCSREEQESTPAPEPQSDVIATPAPTPEPTPAPIETPDPDANRTRRVAEHQRRIQELIRQKQEQQGQPTAQPPGAETQYQ